MKFGDAIGAKKYINLEVGGHFAGFNDTISSFIISITHAEAFIECKYSTQNLLNADSTPLKSTDNPTIPSEPSPTISSDIARQVPMNSRKPSLSHKP